MEWDEIIGVALLRRSVFVLNLVLLSVSVSVSLFLSLWLNCPLTVLDSVDTTVGWDEVIAVVMLRLFCFRFGFGFARSVCLSVSVFLCLWTPLRGGMGLLVWPCCAVLSLF